MSEEGGDRKHGACQGGGTAWQTAEESGEEALGKGDCEARGREGYSTPGVQGTNLRYTVWWVVGRAAADDGMTKAVQIQCSGDSVLVVAGYSVAEGRC